MKIKTLYKIVLLIIFGLSTSSSIGQSLPVGTPLLEDYYRRQQLLGKVDSSISFTSKPFFPVEALRLKNGFDPDTTFNDKLRRKYNGIHRFWGSKGIFQLLPLKWQQQFNTHHPYSLNDGAMIPARGYQTMMSGGFYAKLGPMNIQFQPEVVLGENKKFNTFMSFKRTNEQLIAYYNYKNLIDLPEYFKDEPYKRVFWGQSSVRLTVGPISAGISTENLWWGPGMSNSLLMTNSAAGFLHFTLNTVKPVRTPIGSFEGQVIGGRLDPSDFFEMDTSLVIDGNKLYRTKRNDWRYLNGIVLSYQPRWISGLFLGLARSFMVYHNDMGHRFSDYFPIFSALEKKNNYGEGESKFVGDQLALIFVRWLLEKDHAEIYFEYGREDHSYNVRDFLIQPDYSRAYLLGFRKIFPLTRSKDTYIQANFEITQLEANMTNIQRSPPYIWYAHIAGIWHGYTEEGQLVGAGIGPGSSMQSASIAWFRGFKSLGIKFERLVHNNDLFYIAVKDIRSHWVDINVSPFAEWNYRNFLISCNVEFIRSLNYQFNYQPVTVGIDQYWIPGKDVYNVQAKLAILYRF